MSSAPRAPTLISIQLLRAAACLMVLLHHARNPKSWMFDPLAAWNFTTGVEIFFVISGFIMYAAARQDAPGEFMRRRIVRIAPLYWIATLTWAAWLMLRHTPAPDPAHLGLSLAMIPHESPTYHGVIWPVLTPGWTLTFEMAFYVLFAVGLAVRRIGLVTAGVILPLVALGFIFKPQGAVLHAFTGPILLAFLAGMGIAWAHARMAFDKAWPLAVLGAVGLAAHASPWLSLHKIWVVAASACLVAGALSFETRLRARPRPVVMALGDASYAIYLFHTLVLAAVMWIGAMAPLAGWTQFLVLMAAGMGTSIAAGLAVHRWIERPMLKALLGLGRRPRQAPAPGPSPALEAAE